MKRSRSSTPLCVLALAMAFLAGCSPDHEELRAWMEENEYTSVGQLRGSASQATAKNPSAFERANYMQTLRSWSSAS